MSNGEEKSKKKKRKKPTSRDIPIASSRRMLKKSSGMRVGKDTAKVLSGYLEDLAEKIGLEAKDLVEIEDGKTIQEKHLKKAIDTVS